MAERGVRGPRPGWWFLAAAALATVLFYREFIFHAGRLLAGSDMVLEGFPLRQFYVDEIRAGRGVPLWTPHVYGGMPYVALLPGPIFYPSTILYFLLPLGRAIGWTFVLHTFLAGAFGYFLGRSFRLRPWAAAVAGASFMLTGYVTSHLFGGQDGRMFAMTLIPLALGILERALRTGDARWWCGLALTVACQIFTPHMQIVYFSSLGLGLYLLFHLAVRVRSGAAGASAGPDAERPGWKAYARPVAGFTLAFAGAAGLGAIQLFPAFALLDHVTRAAPESGYAFASSWALPPQELTALFLPDLIGSVRSYWGQNPIKLHTEYLGAAPIALALLASAASFRSGLRPGQRRTVWFLAGASLLGVLFALGGETPVHRVAYAVIPMMGSFRAPAMMMGVVATFVALLAGFGWESVLAVRARSRMLEEDGADAGDEDGALASPLALVALGAPFLILAAAAVWSPEGLLRFARLSWYPPGWPPQPPAELGPLLRVGGIVVLAGFVVAWGLGHAVATRRLGRWAALALCLFIVGEHWRIASRYLPVAEEAAVLADDEVLRTLRREAGPGERVWAYGTYRANRFMYDGVSSATGNQKFLLEPYARLVGGIRPDEGLLQHPPLIAYFGIHYLIVPSEQRGLEPIVEAPGRLLYRIPAPPHAYFPTEVRVIADPQEAVATVRSNLDPLELAVLEPTAGAGEPPAAGFGAASILRYQPDEFELEVEAERGGLLAVSEIYHPAWRAYLDGEEVPVWRTNVAFRGVEVPEGRHRLRFAYESAAYRAGAWTTGLSALFLAAAFLGALLRRGVGRDGDA